jgi:hypothetical protein
MLDQKGWAKLARAYSAKAIDALHARAVWRAAYAKWMLSMTDQLQRQRLKFVVATIAPPSL